MKNIFYLLPFILVGCAEKTPPKTNLLTQVLQSQHKSILPVTQNIDPYELQIIYTEINKDNEETTFTDHYFQANEDNYFYPASTVKLPVAVLALEFLDQHLTIDPATPYVTDRDTLLHTVAEDLRQIFAVSDNEAYNRLYDLLGRDYINKKLNAKGLNARIAHRLETENPTAANRSGLHFIVATDTLTLGAGIDNDIVKLDMAKIQKGIGYIKNGSLVNEPMDFSEKNYFPIETQHELMKRLFFPENFSVKQQFLLSSESSALLQKEMHIAPRLNGYQEWEVWDSFGKIFLFGDSKGRIPSSFKYYNKVGYAYGTLIDTAYIVDSQNDIAFFLSATMILNNNGIFNDDVYEYGETGIPFLAELGREIYQLELKKIVR